MAIDTEQLTAIYTSLSDATKTTLDEQWDSQRLRGADYANVVAQTITSLIQTSASLIEGEENRNEQASQFSANLAEQARQADAQLAENARQFDAQLAQDAPVKTAQKSLIDKQVITETNKASLTARQTSMYDDNLRVEEGKMLTNVVGMYGVGGTSLPTGLETQMINAVDAVTP